MQKWWTTSCSNAASGANTSVISKGSRQTVQLVGQQDIQGLLVIHDSLGKAVTSLDSPLAPGWHCPSHAHGSEFSATDRLLYNPTCTRPCESAQSEAASDLARRRESIDCLSETVKLNSECLRIAALAPKIATSARVGQAHSLHTAPKHCAQPSCEVLLLQTLQRASDDRLSPGINVALDKVVPDILRTPTRGA